MRDKRIDIIKCLAIILMVLGHSGFPFTKLISLFHMAVFFMVSGYLYHAKYEQGIKGIFKYVVRKIMSIWLPYFIWNLIFTVLNNVLININVYSNIPMNVLGNEVVAHQYLTVNEMLKNILKGVFMIGRTEMGGAFWFLQTLFTVSILFYIIDFILVKLIKKDLVRSIIHTVISLLFLAAGYLASLMDVQKISIPVALSCYILYLLGNYIKKYNVMKHIKSWVAVLCGIIGLIICYQGPGISLGNNSYWNPAYLLICSILGWLLLYGISDFIVKLKHIGILEYIGKNTLSIVIHHFWSLKLVHLIQICLYDYPIVYLSAFPYLNNQKGWWILYCLIGVAVPVLLHWVFEELMKRVKHTSRS